METLEVAPGLWRWTARHPRAADWPVDARDRQPWPDEVGCVYFEAEDAVCLIDLRPQRHPRPLPSPALARPEELDATLAELTALPVERLLVSHGQPLLEHAHERMTEAVELARSQRPLP